MNTKCHVCDGTGEVVTGPCRPNCRDPFCAVVETCTRCSGTGVAPIPCDACDGDAEYAILDRAVDYDPSKGVEPTQCVCKHCVYTTLATALRYEPTSYARPLAEERAIAISVGPASVETIIEADTEITVREWRESRPTIADPLASAPMSQLVFG